MASSACEMRGAVPGSTATPAVDNIAHTSYTSGGRDEMTLQQRQGFNCASKPDRHRGPNCKWTTLELGSASPPATVNTPTIAASPGKNTVGQPAVVPPNSDLAQDPRAPAPAGVTSSLHRNIPIAPVEQLPTQPSISTRTKGVEGIQQKPACSEKENRRYKLRISANMVTATTERAYIPPHMRQKGTRTKADDARALPIPHKSLKSVSTHSAKRKAAGTASGTTQSADKSTTPNVASPRPTSPPLPPSSPDEKAEAEGVTWAGWDSPKSQEPARPVKNLNTRWPASTPNKYKWPKTRDLKPLRIGEDSEGGVSFKSNSNEDPDYDVKKLMDWNGDWLPPPETWSSRKGFYDRHFGAHIESWMNKQDPSCMEDLTDSLILPEYLGQNADGDDDRIVTQELAPRSWVPVKIEGDAPQQFWRALPSRAPPPLSDMDLSESKPYWEAYVQDSESCFLLPPVVPESRLDEEEADNRLPGAKLCSTQIITRIKAEKENRERRARIRQNRPIAPSPRPLILTTGQRLTPVANIYLRPVVAADAADIREIYNHYVTDSISAPEFRLRDRHMIRERIRTVTDEGLPYVVAVDKKKQHYVGQEHSFVSERVVGFVSIDDFCDKGSMYRYTFELELFVHPDYTRKGIGKCLLDRLLDMVNTSYPAKGGYDWINRGDYLKHGSARVVKTINISVPVEHGVDIKWLKDFLKEFQFKEAGYLKKMGYKLDKVVDVALFQHITTEIPDAGVPPLEPL